ncbi:MAG: ADP-ribosylglycohydrolase family protein [Bacillota bacterium]
MLKKEPWLRYTDGLQDEPVEALEEGKDADKYKERVREILSMDDGDPRREELAGAVYDEIQSLPVKKDYPYHEPSHLEGIKAARPVGRKPAAGCNFSDVKLYDKIYGAWLGRCAGCLLGKPVEGWRRDKIRGFAVDTENYPLQFYMSSDIGGELRKKYDPPEWGAWINKVSYMPEDDDTNYTVIGLKILEEYGPGFTPDDVAECWLRNLPILHVCTAERVAYRNLVNRIFPPASASFRNPYREAIGAQIRADFFGYCTPGNPELGAEMAWRDASISHVKNGIYGEMFTAAMLSAAAVSNDAEEVIRVGLAEIPDKSRLAEKVRNVLGWRKEGLTWERAIDRIHRDFNENSHQWLHTISNAVIVCVGLLFGELDLEKSISTAVLSAFDTDCNGATVGSIVGMMLGAEALPEKWIKPLNDQLKSGVDGFGLVKISEMAKRTLDMARKVGEK